MVTATKEEISENIESFFKLHFKKYLDLIKSNNHKIENLEKVSYPELDVVFFFKFIRAELDHLKNLDASIFDKELRILFESAIKAVSALLSFKKNYISVGVLFRNHFSEFNNEAKTINDKFEKTKMEKSINTAKADRITKELKVLKKTNNEDSIKLQKDLNHELADTLQNIQNARIKLEEITIEKKDFEDKYLPIFLETYKRIADKIISLIIKQVAIFSFSTDRELWKNASRSRKIMNFFETIKETENMNIQKYMEYHLKHQTSSESKDEESIKFRKKLINSIEKVKLFNLKEGHKEKR